MENFWETLKALKDNKIVQSVVIVIISFIIYKIIHKIILRGNNTAKLKNMSNKSKTYFRMITSIIRYVFIIVTLLILLQINGVNVSSMLAGVGILSIVIGLAVQDALKDIIRGISILSDDYFHVGDIIKYNDIEGKVLVIGLKTTKIQDIRTNNVIAIANRNIEFVEVVSKDVYINIPMPYDVTLDKAEKAVDDIVNSVKINDNVDDCKYLSVNDLADSSIKYLIKITCNPDYKLQVRRDALRTVLDELAKNNIEVPFQQIDIHNK